MSVELLDGAGPWTVFVAGVHLDASFSRLRITSSINLFFAPREGTFFFFFFLDNLFLPVSLLSILCPIFFGIPDTDEMDPWRNELEKILDKCFDLTFMILCERIHIMGQWAFCNV